MNDTATRILTAGDAMSLGDLLIKLCVKSNVRWMGEDGHIREGQFRSLVKGDSDFCSSQGMDVRDAYCWISGRNGFEYTVSVAYLLTLFDEGGIAFD